MANPTPQELKLYIKPKLEAAKYDWPTFEKQIQQESGWQHYNSNGTVKMSYTGSSAGVGQLNKSYYPEDIWSDPYKNINAAADTAIANLKKFGTYRKALAAYNWGAGNVGGYTNVEGVHPAWDGSRTWKCPVNGQYCATAQRDHYLDVILGPEWKEPSQTTMSDNFSVGEGLRALMTAAGDTPATDEMYYKNPAGKDQYSEALGQSGARYVYVFSTNKNYRFLPD